MKRSAERILTTHTGSLPRPRDLAEMLEAYDRGTLPDERRLAECTREAVSEVVRKQREVGLDIINDGEQGKVGFSTYVRHRLTGFEGRASTMVRGDWADFPEAASRRPAPLGYRPACNGPIEWKDRSAIRVDLDDIRASTKDLEATEVFVTSASPGVICHTLPNEYYPSRGAYLARLAEVMKEEYDAIHQAGFLLQLDCPDLAMGRHMWFADLPTPEFLKVVQENLEALDHAVRDIPPDRIRLHLCWGNYEGPHHRDIPLKDIIGLVLQARPQAISFEGANPRHEHEWAVFKEVKLPDDKLIIPGVLDSTTNFIEHPELVAQRIVRYAELVGKEKVIAGADCGFSTFATTDPVVEPPIVWAKLRSLVEGAQIASKLLW